MGASRLFAVASYMQVDKFVSSRKLSDFCGDIRIITINDRIRCGQWPVRPGF